METIEYPELQDLEDKKLDLPIEAAYLTFNYTLTLENVYKISNVWHIHNIPKKIIRKTRYPISDDINETDIVLGFDENKKINIPKTEYEDMITGMKHSEIYKYLVKPTSSIINCYQNKFDIYRNFNKVIILGHSLGDCDIPYFCEIEKRLDRKASLEVSYYNINDKPKLFSQSRKFINGHNIMLKSIKEFEL